MNNVVQKLKKNKNITRLLKDFEKDFKRVYENLEPAEKAAMLGVRDAIFRKWLFSPIVDETYVTPAYLVNSIVVIGGEKNAMILPHIKAIVMEDGTLEFETQWLVYDKSENHPMLQDLNRLMDMCNPTLIVREGNHYIIDNGEALIEEINFRSNYYLKYLMDIALDLGILEELKAIGCKCYRPAKYYEEFNGTDNGQKLEAIKEISINMANKQFKEQLNYKDQEIVQGFFKEFINIEDFSPYISHLESIHRQSFNEFLGTLNKKDKAKMLGEVENITSEGIPSIVAMAEFGVLLDNCFSTVFGYYLGLLIPTYPDMFSIDIFMQSFLGARDEQFRMNVIFEVEACHHLTQFGSEIFKDCKKEMVLHSFDTINLKYLGEEIDKYIHSKEVFLREDFGVDNFDFLSGNFLGEDEDEFETVYEVLDEYFQEDEIQVPKVIFKHIVEFADYLAIDKNLKIETCEKHCQNIETFIWDFLKGEKVKDLKKIDEKVVHEYLGNWYIRKAATSKTNVKEQISSLTHYSRYLEKKKVIGSKVGNEIRILLKANKDTYINSFDEYMEEDYF